MTTSAQTLAEVELQDPIGGGSLRFGDLSADPLTVILVRYFGCLPCQAFLAEVDRRVEEFPGRVIAVGGSADYQARWLREKKGVTLPMLLDAPQVIRTALDIADLTTGELSSGRGWANYGKAISRDTTRRREPLCLCPNVRPTSWSDSRQFQERGTVWDRW